MMSNCKRKKVAVAMSGGVDSSVAAAMMVENATRAANATTMVPQWL